MIKYKSLFKITEENWYDEEFSYCLVLLVVDPPPTKFTKNCIYKLFVIYNVFKNWKFQF